MNYSIVQWLSRDFKFFLVMMTFFSGLIGGQALAADATDADKTAIIAGFAKNFPQVKVTEINTTAFPGLFEVLLDNMETVFANKDSSYLLVGAKMLQVKGPGQVVDLSEQKKNKSRISIIENLNLKETVGFKGEGKKTTPIYVFTDVDCGYCRKLHDEVPALQKAGIDVFYFAWPRAGVESDTGSKMHDIWCAKDQQTAMTMTKAGGKPPKAKADCTSPLQSQLELGMKLGVAGTPAIFTQTGEQIGGYAEAASIIKMLLNQDSAQ